MNERSNILGQIVSEARDWLLESVRSLVPRYEDAEDIVQDVLYQFTAGFDQIKSLESSSAWLYQAAKHRVSDFYRKRSRTIEGSQTSVMDSAGEGAYLLQNLLLDHSEMPERNFDNQYLESRLESAIESLPESQREVFIWHEIEGYSFKEIAELTGETQNTLLSRKRYAVLALREKLKDLYHK
ncbi:sigma-70 family RNA polymerase sigma factor [bacterium]|nr:sigma-70 family RNA polymerase sigma factor [bacterium]